MKQRRLFLILIILTATFSQIYSANLDYTRLWGTYYGNAGEETSRSKAFTSDSENNIIVVGGTKSGNYNDFIASPGAYQTGLNGARDVFIVKYNQEGERLWSTFFGGNQWDFARDVCTDDEDNIYITGFTGSTTVIGSDNSFQPTLGGGDDAFIAKFDKNGNRIWSTYLGGSVNEHVHAIDYIGNGKIITCGRTVSEDFPLTQGAHQSAFAGVGDAYLAMLDTNGNLLWSTYFGGDKLDTGKDVVLKDNGNIILMGLAESSENIATPGAYQSELNGDGNSFLAEFTPEGELVKATYFGGDKYEHPQALGINSKGEIILAGETQSTDIGTNGTYQPERAGNFDSFIAKFDSNLDLIECTYFGGAAFESAVGLDIDENDNILICGSTESSSGISTSGVWQQNKNDNSDGYFAVFNNDLELEYASYYGAGSTEHIFGILSDGNTLTIAGATKSNSPDVFVTDGAQQSIYRGNMEIFIARFISLNELISPQLLMPENGSEFPVAEINFEWTSVNSALEYELVISGNEIEDKIFRAAETQYLLNDTLPAGEYNWKVKAINGSDESKYSESYSFTIGGMLPGKIVLNYPPDDTTNMPVNLALKWENDEYAEEYTLNLYDADMNNIMRTYIDEETGIYSTKDLKYLTPNSVYYWNVIGENELGKGTLSETWKFTTGNSVPRKVYLELPLDNSEVQGSEALLEWNKLQEADSYNLLVYDSEMDEILNEIIPAEEHLQPKYTISDLVIEADYFWKARASNELGDGEWSDTWKFTTIESVPDKVVLRYPPDNSTGVERNLEFIWENLPDADSYELILMDYQSNIILNSNSSENEGEIVSDSANMLEEYTTYKWRVRGINDIGSGEWSETWQFTTGDALGVDEEIPGLSFYTNSGYLIIKNDNKNVIDQILIYDILGNPVYSSANVSGKINRVDITGFSAGAYLLRIEHNGKVKSGKFIIN